MEEREFDMTPKRKGILGSGHGTIVLNNQFNCCV